MASIKDRSHLVPFVLFAIFAGIVAYSMYKGTHREKGITAEEYVEKMKNQSQI